MDWADVIPLPAARTATMANRRKKYFAGFPNSAFIVTPKVELFALTWNAMPAPNSGHRPNKSIPSGAAERSRERDAQPFCRRLQRGNNAEYTASCQPLQ